MVARVRAAGCRVVFLSNKPIDSRETYAAKLTDLGIPTEAEDVINSSLVMARYLAQRTPGATVIAIGEPPLLQELARSGLRIADNPRGARWVVIAFDRTFDYPKLNLALQASRHGAELIATNPDPTCPVEGGEIPDCAAMIGAIEGCTGQRVQTIVGKPSPIMLSAALERVELAATTCLLVGDRPETDVQMGIAAGVDTALVLTGVTQAGAEPTDDYLRPTYLLESITQLERFL